MYTIFSPVFFDSRISVIVRFSRLPSDGLAAGFAPDVVAADLAPVSAVDMMSPEAIAPDIRVVYYGERATGQGAVDQPNMLRLELIPSLTVFAALLLMAALLALAASGHFPRRAGAQNAPGTFALAASIIAGTAATLVGLVAAWRHLPWPPAVIAGGLAVLAAPLVLQQCPDRFVDGRGALAAFGAGTVVLAGILVILAA
jgi:hypothetical protein